MNLIEKLEAATGPDRGLDALIWCYLHGKKYKGHVQAYNSELTQVFYTEPPKRTQMVTLGIEYRPHAERFTASVDAAMMLVPRGWIICITRSFNNEGEYVARAELTDSFSVGRGRDADEEITVRSELNERRTGDDPTARAICIAAIKAREGGEE